MLLALIKQVQMAYTCKDALKYKPEIEKSSEMAITDEDSKTIAIS